jgi:hypothetical protein
VTKGIQKNSFGNEIIFVRFFYKMQSVYPNLIKEKSIEHPQNASQRARLSDYETHKERRG